MLVVINIYSLMRGGLCGKLHRPPSQLLFAQQQSSIDSQLFIPESRVVPTQRAFDAALGGLCRNIVIRFGMQMGLLPDSEKILKICLFV